jgi:hypothetical protein
MLLFLFITSALASVSICEKAPYLFHVSDISINPQNEVVPGQIITLSVNYSTPILVTEGTSKATIRYAGIALPSFTQSICDLTSCPIQPGKHNFTYEFQYPRGFPGRTKTSIIWYDMNATVFLCLSITLRSISTFY